MADKTAKTQDSNEEDAQADAREAPETTDVLEEVLKGAADTAAAENAETPDDPPADVDPEGDPDPEDNAAMAGLMAARIAELEAENEALKDRLLRAMADAENTRRRAERDKADALSFGGSKLAKDLLVVQDNLDRALKAADDNLRETAKDFIEGVELTRRELINAFAKHKIEAVEPELGEKFDPNLHQAMFEAPVPGAKPGTVIDVVQTGFTIAGRLLRPAAVGVAKAAPAEESAKE